MKFGKTKIKINEKITSEFILVQNCQIMTLVKMNETKTCDKNFFIYYVRYRSMKMIPMSRLSVLINRGF